MRVQGRDTTAGDGGPPELAILVVLQRPGAALMERGATRDVPWEARSGGGVSLLSLSLWKGARARERERSRGGRRGDRGERPREDRAQGARVPGSMRVRGGANRGTRGRDRQEGVGLGLEGGVAGPWA